VNSLISKVLLITIPPVKPALRRGKGDTAMVEFLSARNFLYNATLYIFLSCLCGSELTSRHDGSIILTEHPVQEGSVFKRFNHDCLFSLSGINSGLTPALLKTGFLPPKRPV